MSWSFQHLYSPSPCNKIYRREVFQNIRYPNNFYEDRAILVSLLVGNKLCSIDLPLYFYFYPRSNSKTKDSFEYKKIKDLLAMLEMMKQQLIQNNIWTRYKDEFSILYIFMTWHYAHGMIKTNVNFKKHKWAFYKYLDRSIFNIKNIKYLRKLQDENPQLNHLPAPYLLSILLCFGGVGILFYRIIVFTSFMKSILYGRLTKVKAFFILALSMKFLFYTTLNSIKTSFSLHFPLASRILKPFYKLFFYQVYPQTLTPRAIGCLCFYKE